jgi:chromosome segregation ATPase
MLEDLDHLTRRISVLVAKLQSLQAQTTQLSEQVATLTAERDGLAGELQAELARQQALTESLGSAKHMADQAQKKALEDRAALQGTLDLFRQENESMQSSLKSREDEVRRLKEVNQKARERIDGVLEKLPGALSREAS